MKTYRTRLVDQLITDLLRDLPAVLLIGPRAAGKTTTARRLAKTVVQLDRETEAAAFAADPDVALQGLEEPVLFDEWQVVPTVLGAVKRAVDRDFRPGRFLLTGSVHAELKTGTWPGTGRIVPIPLHGLTMREIAGDATGDSVIDRLASEGPASLVLPADVPDLRGYLEHALTGGFPEPALEPSPTARTRWLNGWVDQILTRDTANIGESRDPVLLRRYFEALCLNTAGIVADKTLYDAVGITAKTAADYERLLTRLFVVEAVPAWFTNRLKRLARSPKRYFLDAAIAAAALRLTADGLLREAGLMGRILDTFVLAQIRAEVTVSTLHPRIHHLRVEKGRHEIDIVIELSGHRVIGIEVKADSAPDRSAGRHLAWLRDELGPRFLTGLVLHTGPRVFRLDEKIVAAPICTLWG